MSEALTPLQEFMAERAAQIEEGSKLPGGRGAFNRLLKRLDCAEVTQWIMDERNRGLPDQEIAEALGNYVANLVSPLCLPNGPAWPKAARYVFRVAIDCLMGMASGETGTDAVLVNRLDGRQIMTTTVGVAKDGVPK